MGGDDLFKDPNDKLTLGSRQCHPVAVPSTSSAMEPPMWSMGPPVLVGERVLWLGSGSGVPQGGVVRWMGVLPEMGPTWTVGLELDVALPYGGIDGCWGGRRLFRCKARHGLLVPFNSTVREKDVCPPNLESPIHHGRHDDPSVSPNDGFSAPSLSPVRFGTAPTSPPGVRACAGASGSDAAAIHSLPLSDRFIPKAATRRKHTPSFVQSLPLVEEETKQALYAIVDEDKEKAKPPCPPRRQKTNSSRQSRSGDYSSYKWWEGARSDVYEDVITRSTSVGHVFPPRGDNGTMNRPTEPTAYHSATTSSTSSSGRRDKSNSGLFSFLRWFKKDRKSDAEFSGDEETVYPNSLRSRGSSCSIDTVFSTATVTSFSYVSPTAYRRQNPVSPVQRRALVSPETDTYRRRLRQRDRRRELDRNISLRKKYRLYGSDSTIQRSTDSLDERGTVSSIPEVVAEAEEIPTCSKHLVKSEEKHYEVSTIKSTTSSNPFAGDGYESLEEEKVATSSDFQNIPENTSTGRKKRKAPAPPINGEVRFAEYSLPNTLTHKTDGDSAEVSVGCASLQLPRPSHRRTSSDTTTDKKPTIHVRGKRRAPTPPIAQTDHSTASRTSTALKKKRLAPQPPVTEEAVSATVKDEFSTSVCSASAERKANVAVTSTPTAGTSRDSAIVSATSATESVSSTVIAPNISPLIASSPPPAISPLPFPVIEPVPLSAIATSSSCAIASASTTVISPPSKTVSIPVSTTAISPVSSAPITLNSTPVKASVSDPVPVCVVASASEALTTSVPTQASTPEIKTTNPSPHSSALPVSKLETRGTLEVNTEEDVTATGTTNSKERRDVSNLTPDQRQLLINNISKLQAYGAHRGSMNTPPGSPLTRHIGFNQKNGAGITNNADVIKVDAGAMKQRTENMSGTPSRTSSPAALETVAPMSPVSPRPWYKRSSVHRESGGLGLGLRKDIFKSLEKKKDKDKHDEWMPEAGIPRSTPVSHTSEHSTISKFNIFARLTEDKKKDLGEKRKSQLSILTNISALDREAAEIVQEHHAKERALLAAQNDKYYAAPQETPPVQNGNKSDDEAAGPSDGPRRNSAKELISLFNALSHVPTRVSANAALYPKENGCPSPRNTPEKRTPVMQERLKHNGNEKLSNTERIDDNATPRSPYARRRVGSPITVTSDLKETIPSSEKIRAGPAPLAAVDDDDIDEPAVADPPLNSAVNQIKRETDCPTIPSTAQEAPATSSERNFRTSVHMTVAPDTSGASGPNLSNGETETPRRSFPVSKSSSNVTTKVVNIFATENERTKGSDAKASMFWICTRCTLENPRWRFTCDACSNWRPAERKEKTENGEERIDNPIFVQEDANLLVKRQQNVNKGINWEEELKRYFPAPKKESNTSNKNALPDRIPETSVKEEKREIVNENEPVQPSTSASSVQINAIPIQKAPSSTFIGGRLPQDEAKLELTKSKSEVSVGKRLSSETTVNDKPDIDEVRKARLAFFRRSNMNDLSNNDDVQVNKQSGQINKQKSTEVYADLSAAVKGMNQTERGRLKEILKEMKNSLPKKSKQAVDTGAVTEMQGTGPLSSTSTNNVGEVKTGAIKKQYTVAKNSSVGDSAKVAEAIFITRQIVYDDIKVRKTDARSSKVSSSCQTNSSVVRKPEQSVSFKPTIVGVHPSPNVPTTKAFRRGILLPVKVENRTTEIKDGMLYTSLSKDTRRIGTGTFELIRPRDFASIEATKIGSEAVPIHVYANVPHVVFPVQLAALPKDVLGPVPPELAPMIELKKPDPFEKKRSSSSVTESSSGFATPADLPSERHSTHALVSPVASSRSSSTATSRSALLNGSSSKSVTSSSSSSAGSSVLASGFSGSVSGSASPSGNTSINGSTRYSTSTNSPSVNGSTSNAASVSSSRPPSESGASSRSVSDTSEVERLTLQLSGAQGIADFKADFDSRAGDANTLAVNRLLRRLETAIAEGRHQEAAALARDLARLKINCCVTRQKNRPSPQTQTLITVDMYVEDKVSHQGPIPLQVSPDMTVYELKQLVARQFEIPEHVQRWILGKQLATEDTRPLRNHLITENGCPVFLYLVAPDGEADNVDDGSSSSSSQGNVDAAGVSGQRSNLGPPPVMPPDAPGKDPNRRGGWYYNYEEDRYSFCEDSDEENDINDDNDDDQVNGDDELDEIVDLPDEFPEEPPPAPPRIDSQADSERKTAVASTSQVVQPTKRNTPQPHARSPSPPAVAGTSKTPVAPARSKPLTATPAVKSHGKPPAPTAPTPFAKEPSKKTESFSQTADTASTALLAGAPVPVPSVSAATPSTSAGTGVPSTSANTPSTSSSVAAAREEPGLSGVKLKPSAPPLERDTGTMTLGWKCPLCTLVNSPTRPGCAACTTERPANYRVPTTYCPTRQNEQPQLYEAGMDEKLRNYQQLINLDRQDLVRSVEPFECSICLTAYEAAEGVVLRECLHTFCRTCLIHTVQFSEEAEVKCPYRDADYACDGVMQEREIKALVTPEMYEQHLAKSMTQAENKIGNAFHCKTPDCRGWCIFEDNVNEFRCPVCRATNCLTCQAIHFGVNCKEYQARVAEEAETNVDARRTREMLNEMVARGEAMTCPSCQVVLMKKWGCDWLRCSMCKTEICWVTRGPRWGPGGKGDTSGGCKCGVNGVKCHAKCNYCH